MISRRRLVAPLAAAVAVVMAVSLGAFAPAADPDVQLQLGRFLFSQGMFRDALDAFQSALDSNDAATRVPARKGVVQSSLRVAD